MNTPSPQLASEKIVLAAPMSFHGSAARIWKLHNLGSKPISRTLLRTLAVVLITAVTLGLTLSQASRAANHHPSRTQTFQVGTRAHTYDIRGRGRDLKLVVVKVDGKAIELAEFSTLTMYGNGVAVRFSQRRQVHYVRAVALSGRHRLTLVYELS